MEEINPAELRSVCQAINVRYGIDLEHYEPKSLSRRIYKVIQKYELGGIHGLWMRVLRDQQFIYQMIDDLTVGLTEMFRNPKLWQYLRDQLLPQYAGQPRLDIWHAACSSGEEVYTLRIVLKELGLAGKAFSRATDINQKALEVAKSAKIHQLKVPIYSRNYARFHQNGHHLDKWLMPLEGEFHALSNGLRSNVRFSKQNLVNDPYPQMQDLVFCRNVLIYFDKSLQGKVFERLHASLKPGGYLILGFYDTNPNGFQDQFELVDSGYKIYQRKS